MPRKPNRHGNPNRAIHNRTAAAERNVKRKTARVIYLQRLMKEREIGVDPIFDHGRGRNETFRAEIRKEWLKRSREYDERTAA